MFVTLFVCVFVFVREGGFQGEYTNVCVQESVREVTKYIYTNPSEVPYLTKCILSDFILLLHYLSKGNIVLFTPL